MFSCFLRGSTSTRKNTLRKNEIVRTGNRNKFACNCRGASYLRFICCKDNAIREQKQSLPGLCRGAAYLRFIRIKDKDKNSSD